MTAAVDARTWADYNQRHLAAALARVAGALRRHAGGEAAPEEDDAHAVPAPDGSGEPALERIAGGFALSDFERDVLVLCAGAELDAGFAALCAAAHGDPRRTAPTFGLALAALPGAHWSALSPAAPLRHWQLVHLDPRDGVTSAALRVDERILHFLAGVWCMDERLEALLEPLAAPPHLPPTHERLAERVAAALAASVGEQAGAAVQLCGDSPAASRAVAAAACALLGASGWTLRAADLPRAADARRALLLAWERETVLAPGVLVVEWESAADDAETQRAVTAFAERAASPVVVASRDPLRTQRLLLRVDLPRPPAAEQRMLWERALGQGAAAANGRVDRLVSHFDLDAQGIAAAAAAARADGGQTDGALWDACRTQSRPRMDDLAQRIEAVAGWDDLVLPPAQMQVLREMAAHVRHRSRVYEAWGFAARSSRGLGISALFAGASGTGKTMAAEVLAGELRLDLYRIDLSSVVSKYIGETEKNLRRIFDAAEQGGAVLLFDEADALFGKRSEVKDSHDRYANIEVSYLLQRMEAYRGLAILTTNQKAALDTAFLRRIRFVVDFPFPDAGQRAEIWRRVFPAQTPTEELDPARLARLNVAGGNIRNIAVLAAFLAADADEPVRMSHLLRAARSEYAKLEKHLTDAETGGWR
ncbi:MAG TPA: ATP-binding protein [Longimicrobium sp.]